MLMKPEDFLQKPKICRGEIHLVNMKRRFYNLDNEYIKADYMLTKKRPCVIYSSTEGNVENCLVIPIKTKGSGNKYGYEIYKDIMLLENHPSLVCISQMTLIPLEAIDKTSLGVLKPSVMKDIDDLVDIFLGRRPSITINPNKVTTDKKVLNEVTISLFSGFLKAGYQPSSSNKARKYLHILKREFEKETKKKITHDEMCASIKKCGYEIIEGMHNKYYINNITAKQEETMNRVTQPKKTRLDDFYFESLSEQEKEEYKDKFKKYTQKEFMEKYNLNYAQFKSLERNFGKMGIYSNITIK